MKLTSEDKALLLNLGYKERDFEQIEDAMCPDITKYELNSKPISREEVIKLIGMENYLASISRSAFHWSTVHETDRGEVIDFDSSRLFRDEEPSNEQTHDSPNH